MDFVDFVYNMADNEFRELQTLVDMANKGKLPTELGLRLRKIKTILERMK